MHNAEIAATISTIIITVLGWLLDRYFPSSKP